MESLRYCAVDQSVQHSVVVRWKACGTVQSTSQYSTVWWSDGKLAVLCSRPVSTAQCGGQMESLWYCSYGGSRGLELDMETSGAFWIWISVPGTWSVHTGLAAFGVFGWSSQASLA